MGWLGDRYNRKLLLAGGVGLWSLATVGTAFSADFYHMFFWRALLGLGEASYGAIAPALIADLFPVKAAGPGDGGLLPGPARRARRWDTSWGARSPIRLGWQAVFFVVGLPGLAGRAGGAGHQRPGPRSLGRRGRRVEAPIGPALQGLSRPVPDADLPVQHRGHGGRDLRDRRLRGLGLDVLSARASPRRRPKPASGSACCWSVAGMLGIVLGMFLPDLLRKLTRRAYLLLAAFAVLAATPLGVLGILDPDTNRRWLPVRGVGPDVDGARAVQHGDGQRRARPTAGPPAMPRSSS